MGTNLVISARRLSTPSSARPTRFASSKKSSTLFRKILPSTGGGFRPPSLESPFNSWEYSINTTPLVNTTSEPLSVLSLLPPEQQKATILMANKQIVQVGHIETAGCVDKNSTLKDNKQQADCGVDLHAELYRIKVWESAFCADFSTFTFLGKS